MFPSTDQVCVLHKQFKLSNTEQTEWLTECSKSHSVEMYHLSQNCSSLSNAAKA